MHFTDFDRRPPVAAILSALSLPSTSTSHTSDLAPKIFTPPSPFSLSGGVSNPSEFLDLRSRSVGVSQSPLSSSLPSFSQVPSSEPRSSSPFGKDGGSRVPSTSAKEKSWASMARGSSLGDRNDRRVSLEELQRLQQVFSETVDIQSERLEVARKNWGNALIGKFLGRRMDSDVIARALEYKWKLNTPILEIFLVFRFANEEDQHRVQTSGPWVVGGSVLTIEEWKPNFKP